MKYASDCSCGVSKSMGACRRAVPGITVRDNENIEIWDSKHLTHSGAPCGAGEVNMNIVWLQTATGGSCTVTDRQRYQSKKTAGH
jgi:hypothetical protein